MAQIHRNRTWNVLGGYGGYLNLGIGAFFGVGVYTLAILENSFGTPLILGVIAAAVTAALFALVDSHGGGVGCSQRPDGTGPPEERKTSGV